jgi:hypothetical protein
MLQSLSVWKNSTVEGKSDGKSISLAVAIIYMMNALNSRPNPYQAESDMYSMLIHGCLNIQPGNPYTTHMFGILWPNDLRAFTVDIPAPHIPGANGELPSKVFQRLYGKTLILLRLHFQEEDNFRRRARQPNGNQQQAEPPRRRRVRNHPGPEEGADLVQINANELRFAAGVRPRMANDLRNAMTDSVNRCLARFYMDILDNVPVPRIYPNIPEGERPYCILTDAQKRSANAECFKDTKLSNVWRRVIVREDHKIESWDAVIDRLFPTDSLEESGQTFSTLPYLKEWISLMSPLTPRSRVRIQFLLSVSASYPCSIC